MATGKSGTWQFNSTSAQSYLTMGAVKFIWEEEYDIASNTSTVKITSMQLLAGGDGYGNQNYGLGNLWFNVDIRTAEEELQYCGRSLLESNPK